MDAFPRPKPVSAPVETLTVVTNPVVPHVKEQKQKQMVVQEVIKVVDNVWTHRPKAGVKMVLKSSELSASTVQAPAPTTNTSSRKMTLIEKARANYKAATVVPCAKFLGYIEEDEEEELIPDEDS